MARALCLAIVALLAFSGMAAGAAGTVTGAYFAADKPFPRFTPMFFEGWGFKDAEGEQLVYAKSDMPLGGYVFVHLRNAGDRPIKVTDLQIEGLKMSKALAKTNDTAGELEGHSILVSDLPKDKIDILKNAGHPMWWKAEPSEIQPGRMGQIVVRMRRVPKLAKINFVVETSGGLIPAVVTPKNVHPRFESISFSPDLRTVWLYPRALKPTLEPERVLMDGNDVTGSCRIGADEALDISPVILKLEKPLDPMSYHCFEATYPDGSTAIAGIRAWGNEIVYGMWGARGEAKAFYQELADHNVNAQMGHAGKDVTEMSLHDDGLALLTKLGIRNMATWHGNARNTLFYFLQDEPDAQDPGIDDLPPDQRLGLCGQYLVNKMNLLRAKDAKTPILLNIDNTYKPENWYMYHQLSDIPCLDPYYQGELGSVYRNHPGGMLSHYKPDYVTAATTISQSSSAPKPLHVILCSTKYEDPKQKNSGRFPTPEDIRIQVYYALAAGAKGLSYWWFTPAGECYGCGANDPPAKALWNEIGILGAEVRTAGPIITSSCPAALPVEASRWLQVRTLISGSDTVAVIATNDNILCDRIGCVYKPIEKARVSVTLPEWLKPSDCFEISSKGIAETTWKPEGRKLSLELGTVELSRLIVVTSDTGLKARLTKIYADKFASNVAKLSELKP